MNMAETGFPDIETSSQAEWQERPWRALDRIVAWRVGAALAVSLALHGALLYGYRLDPPAAVPPAPPPLTVWLRPAPPAPAPAPAPVVESKPEPAPKPVNTETKTKREAKKTPGKLRSVAPSGPPSDASAVLATTPADPAAAEAVPNGAADAAPAEPKFDMEAARKAAREIASRPDPERAATAVGQIPPKPIPDETPLARRIASAKRSDCKNQPGGLLAPLLMLLDKKDSGCKL